MTLPGLGDGEPFGGTPLESVTKTVTEVAKNDPTGVTATAGHAAAALARTPGIDDWSCRPSSDHPHPVVLVHGTFGNAQNYWLTTAPMLAASGYCVFRLDYGAEPSVPLLHGIGPIEESAEQLAEYVDRVLKATGAEKVDIVGHSQGGMMPRYYLKSLGGARKVNQLVALAPSNHGTTMEGLIALARQFPGAEELIKLVPPACQEQIAGSDFLTRLNDGGETVADVQYTVIATRYDEVVTPHTSSFLAEAPNVRNLLLQDLNEADLSEHVAISFDAIALREVIRTLDAGVPARSAVSR